MSLDYRFHIPQVFLVLAELFVFILFALRQDKTELVQLQENLFQSQKEGLHENVATVLTKAEVWGTANERDLSQALQYEHEALKVYVIEWAALGDNDRFIKLAHMKLKVQELQGEGTFNAFVFWHPLKLV